MWTHRESKFSRNILNINGKYTYLSFYIVDNYIMTHQNVIINSSRVSYLLPSIIFLFFKRYLRFLSVESLVDKSKHWSCVLIFIFSKQHKHKSSRDNSGKHFFSLSTK